MMPLRNLDQEYDETPAARPNLSLVVDPWRREFEEFHRENPWVMAALVAKAREAKAKGYSRIGIGILYELTRWDMSQDTRSSSKWKLNNNHRSYYSRAIMEEHSDLDGFFTTRRTVFDD